MTLLPRNPAAPLTSVFVVASLCSAALCGCSSIKLTSDYDETADFSRLRTYEWLPGPQKPTGDPRLDNSMLHARIRDSVEEQLAARGYQKSTAGRPSFFVCYHALVDKRVNVTSVYDRDLYGGGGTEEYHVYEYDQGTLMLDVLEPAKKQLIWRGTAQAVIDPYASPEKKEARIRKAVEGLLERFPPGKKLQKS